MNYFRLMTLKLSKKVQVFDELEINKLKLKMYLIMLILSNDVFLLVYLVIKIYEVNIMFFSHLLKYVTLSCRCVH